MQQVEAAANQDDAGTGVIVQFPEHKLPQLSLFQLRDGSAVFVLKKGHTPLWMQSAVAWEDPDYVQEMRLRQLPDKVTQSEPSNTSAAPKLSAAEELVQQYGHLDKTSRKRARRLVSDCWYHGMQHCL